MIKRYCSAIASIGVLLLMITYLNSCTQVEVFTKATIETCQITSVTESTAICGGIISADGGSEVTLMGLCWSTSPNPTIEDDTIIATSRTLAFTSSLSELLSGTTYYIRAYAVNKGGIAYGLNMIFTTKTGVIEITTNAATSNTVFNAFSGGIITSDGGVVVTARGICWSTSQNPTTSNSISIDGAGLGSFTSIITDLSPNTVYYVRAYATNNVGTVYGNEVSFTTLGCITDIDGNEYKTVKIGNQIWMVENLKTTKFNDGTSIPLTIDGTEWINLKTPSYCFYNNDTINKSKYGALYNWYAVNTGILAPSGWHIPTDTEWTTLENYLITNGYNFGGTTILNNIAKSLAATTDWKSSASLGVIGNDLTINNSSGFTALPGGYRKSYGSFSGNGLYGYWWSSTRLGNTETWGRILGYDLKDLPHGMFESRSFGLSVRCVRND